MRFTKHPLNAQDFVKAAPSWFPIPFFLSPVPAGFASPATDYIEKVCSLDDLCITNPDTTYFVRCTGDSMIDDGLWDRDIMIVDRSPEHYEGRIVVAWLNGEYTVKRYHKPEDGPVVLMPANVRYAPIYVQADDDFRVFGVVTFWLKKAQTKKVFEP